MMDRIKENLEGVLERIEDASKKSGRSSKDVTLIGVTKYVDVNVTRSLLDAGCTNLGESRPQVLWEKSAALSDVDVCWHMIGHLQRNKVKRTVASASLIHSVDSLRLLNAIDAAADKSVEVLLEVNVSGEIAKHGFEGPALEEVLDTVQSMSNITVKGLMCMAGLAGDLEDARREFGMLREIRDAHASHESHNVSLKELSMGMSGDFEIAIEEGATMIRVGSSLFEGIR